MTVSSDAGCIKLVEIVPGDMLVSSLTHTPGLVVEFHINDLLKIRITIWWSNGYIQSLLLDHDEYVHWFKHVRCTP